MTCGGGRNSSRGSLPDQDDHFYVIVPTINGTFNAYNNQTKKNTTFSTPPHSASHKLATRAEKYEKRELGAKPNSL
jgi:hypothetical protein